MDWWVWMIVIIMMIGYVVLVVQGFSAAADRRHAWNLWAAGIIDDDELQRRLDRSR